MRRRRPEPLILKALVILKALASRPDGSFDAAAAWLAHRTSSGFAPMTNRAASLAPRRQRGGAGGEPLRPNVARRRRCHEPVNRKNDICAHVTRHRTSADTRPDAGRDSRDAFATPIRGVRADDWRRAIPARSHASTGLPRRGKPGTGGVSRRLGRDRDRSNGQRGSDPSQPESASPVCRTLPPVPLARSLLRPNQYTGEHSLPPTSPRTHAASVCHSVSFRFCHRLTPL